MAEDLLNRFKEEFLALQWHRPVAIELSAQDAWFLLSALQLAVRHPTYKNMASAQIVRRIAQELQDVLVTPGTALAQVTQAGWAVRYDQALSTGPRRRHGRPRR